MVSECYQRFWGASESFSLESLLDEDLALKVGGVALIVFLFYQGLRKNSYLRRIFTRQPQPVVQRNAALQTPHLETPQIATEQICTLMCTPIPEGLAIQINGNTFDVRYFLKAMLTQRDPVDPYTRNPLSREDLKKICDVLSITPEEFRWIWHPEGRVV